MQWGMELLGPFALSPDQLKHLVVVFDYFIKWIEAEALEKIIATSILKFFKKKVLARF